MNIMAMSIFVGILITTQWSLGIGRVDPIPFYPRQNQSLRVMIKSLVLKSKLHINIILWIGESDIHHTTFLFQHMDSTFMEFEPKVNQHMVPLVF